MVKEPNTYQISPDNAGRSPRFQVDAIGPGLQASAFNAMRHWYVLAREFVAARPGAEMTERTSVTFMAGGGPSLVGAMSPAGLRLTHEFSGDWFEYDLGTTTFAITSTDTDHPVPVRGALAAFEVADLDAEIARLERMAIALFGDIRETPVFRFVNLRDPDVGEIILHQRKGIHSEETAQSST